MNTTIYATILTGLGAVITLIVAIHTMTKANQQETNRRIDDLKQETNRRIDYLKQDTKRWIDDTNRRIDELRQDTNRQIGDLRQDLLAAIDNKSKINEAQFEIVSVRFQKLEEDVSEVRLEVQDLKKVIFKSAA